MGVLLASGPSRWTSSSLGMSSLLILERTRQDAIVKQVQGLLVSATVDISLVALPPLDLGPTMASLEAQVQAQALAQVQRQTTIRRMLRAMVQLVQVTSLKAAGRTRSSARLLRRGGKPHRRLHSWRAAPRTCMEVPQARQSGAGAPASLRGGTTGWSFTSWAAWWPAPSWWVTAAGFSLARPAIWTVPGGLHPGRRKK